MTYRKYLVIGLVIVLVLGLGCLENKQSEKTPISNNVEQSEKKPDLVPSVTEQKIIPKETAIIKPNIYSDSNDLAAKESKIYTYNDFFPDDRSNNVLINVDITAKLGTMIEIKDKKDIGCLDVVNKVRGTEMSNGRYWYYLKCSEIMDTKSATVTITNPDQAISYMIKIETTIAS